MGLLVVASAKGSPGVTTTALLLGGLWPRQSVVAECDPSGADVAWRMPARDGQPLDPQTGVLSLVAAGRKTMHPGLLLQHSQQIVGGLDVLAGVSAPEQAGGVRWDELGRLLADVSGLDVIADLGRIGASTPQNALLARAAAVLMLVDTLPSNVVHLRERLTRLRGSLGGPLAPPVHVAVVAPPKRDRAVREVADALQRADVEVEGVHHLAHDVSGAGFFLGQVRGRADRTALVRSAQPLVATLAGRTARHFVGDEQPAAGSAAETDDAGIGPGAGGDARPGAGPAPGQPVGQPVGQDPEASA
ncbi:MAG TPA: hypothetical protein VFO98_07480 [Marmoricola sp.]|jgi:hypothetical protein|nr:hypothetical protein [Marmoricola sp.]